MRLQHFIFVVIAFYSLRGFAFDTRDSLALEKQINRIMEGADESLDDSFQAMLALKKKLEFSSSTFFQAKVFNSLGDLYCDRGNIDSALFYIQKAIDLRMNFADKAYLATSYESFADIYYFYGEFETSLKYYRKSQAIKEELHIPLYLKSLYNALGKNFMALAAYDSSLYYHEKAFDIFYTQSDTEGIASTMNNWGNTLYMSDFEQAAIEKYKLSIRYYEMCGNYQASISPLINLGEVYSYLEQYDSSLYYNKKALARAKEINANHYYQFYENLANCYLEFGMKDSALEMLNLYIQSSDSIFTLEKAKISIEADAKYHAKEQDQIIALEREKTEKLAAEGESKRKTIYALLATLGLISILVLYFVRNFRQKLKLSLLEIAVKNQEVNSLLKDQEAKSYAALLEGQNAERQRIAQDLHDQLGGTLAAVKVHFSVMDQKISDLQSENRELFNKVNELLGDAVQDVRRISHDLASGRLAKLGLRGALADLMDVLSTVKKLQVDFFMDENLPEFDPKMNQEIYAMVQEIVSNTLKHANATQVELQLNKQDEVCILIFEDNGVGFDYEQAKIKGLGLASLSNRVQRMKGKLTVDSFVGRGTIFIIELPL